MCVAQCSQVKDQLLNCKLSQIGLQLLFVSNYFHAHSHSMMYSTKCDKCPKRLSIGEAYPQLELENEKFVLF